MHCFACDKIVSAETLDTKTGRYYCTDCFAATLDVQLKKDLSDLLSDASPWEQAVLEIATEEDFLPFVDEFDSEDFMKDTYYEEGYNG